MSNENLGPAEQVIKTLMTYTDHLYHNRPGYVSPAANHIGCVWNPAVLRITVDGATEVRTMNSGRPQSMVGYLKEDGRIIMHGDSVARYQPAGNFKEATVWVYSQIAEVYRLNNELAARWASSAFSEDHRDMKTLLAAFMLVQGRKGDGIFDNETFLFTDEDYRDVGEAMVLTYGKGVDGLSPKHILRIHKILQIPEIAEINRKLGCGNSLRKAPLGRWKLAVRKWLAYREDNHHLLEGLVKSGFRRIVMMLSRLSRYKPSTPKFFEALRWKQKQSPQGHRNLSLGVAVKKGDNWEQLSEESICTKIIEEKLSWKVVSSKVPKTIGITPAIVSATIEAGGFSNKDLVIATPTLEALGLLSGSIKDRWEAALKSATDQRASRILSRVASSEIKADMQEASEAVAQKTIAEVMKDMRIYFMVDISGSMDNAIVKAKEYAAQIIQAFPLDRVHVSVFNTMGNALKINHASKAGVEQAFRGIQAGGGTDYAAGFKPFTQKPVDNEDSLFIYVGDEEDSRSTSALVKAIRDSDLRPSAIAMVYLGSHRNCIQEAAASLGVPYFRLGQEVFADVYALPRALKNLIECTPVGKARSYAAATGRVSLVDRIMKTELLQKPAWA